MKFLKKNGGFTLVELIVVIAILAILAAIAVPAYSGYISKANEAADQQLLSAINTAYAAACLENGEDMLTLGGATVTMNGKTITKIEPYGEDATSSFWVYFGGNDPTFKTFTKIGFDKNAGVFKNVDDIDGPIGLYYKGATVQVSAEKISDLVNSNLGQMGADVLLPEMDRLVDWGSDFGLTDMAGSNYWKTVAGYFGVTEEIAGATDDQLANAVSSALWEKLGGDEAAEAQTGEMMTNALALYAAQNATTVTKDSLVNNWLGSGMTEDQVTQNKTAESFGEAAAVYALYMSYANQNGIDITKDEPMDTIIAASGSDEFKNWVVSGDADDELKAFQSSMGIINEASQTDEGREAILAGGFADEDLVGLFAGLMGTN